MPEQISLLLADTCSLFKVGFSEVFRKPEKFLIDKVITTEEVRIKLSEKQYGGLILDWDFPFIDYGEFRKMIINLQPGIKIIVNCKAMTLQIYSLLKENLIDGFFERDLNKPNIEDVIIESIEGAYLIGKYFKEFIPKIIKERKLKSKAFEVFYYLIYGYETKEIMSITSISDFALSKRKTRVLKLLKESSLEHLRSKAIENGLLTPCELKRKRHPSR